METTTPTQHERNKNAKSRRFVTLFASVPVIAAILAVQSCGGVGGPTTNNGGQGSVTAQFLALLSNEQRTASYIGAGSCSDAACHGSDPGSHFSDWQLTAHFENNVSCEGCHGPGSVHRDNPTTENILTFPKSVNPVVCGQCHGPIYDQYKFSQHDKLITSPVQGAITNPNGSGRVSRCIACHGGLFRTLTYDGELDIATMPAEEIQSIAQDIINFVPHSANCVTCHDPHKQTGYLTDEAKEVQLRHSTFSLDTTSVGPGTQPQSFQTIDHICAQCHNGRGADPSDAALTSGTSRPNMHDSNQYNMLLGFAGVEGSGPVITNTAHANVPGQCSHCHMPDSRHTFTVSFNACVPCHTEVDAANRVTSIKTEILNGLYALRVRMSDWAIATYPGEPGNEIFWEYTSTITGEGYTPPAQAGVPIEIKRARHNYYFIVRSGDFGVHNGAYAKHLLTVANENLDDLSVPAAPKSPLSLAQKTRIIKADKARAARADSEDDH
ncbi:MAG: hypothetical protein WD716_08930 [Fimbriimonadaceae bacterium]